MAHAAFSLEGKLEAGLRDLGCSMRNFVEVANEMGVRVSRTMLTDALAGKVRLKQRTLEQLVALKHEMARLREFLTLPNTSPLPLDWSATATVKKLIGAVRTLDALQEDHR
jgi:hypothetical protein